ncbi:MAG TPA: DUF418 domain-containing protein [Chthoniobacterales bacterium]|nr:DUF418 domain-containing protein [Chthoniobacterales bacterium]
MPEPGAERLEHIDALRGFALAAVLLVHLPDFSLYAFLTPDAQASLPTASWDNWIAPLFVILLKRKALTIFTLLFGVSFALQLKRTESSSRFSGYFVRRLCVLLVIGIVHSIFYYGDILRYYAVMGLFLLPAKRLPPRPLALIGIVIALFPWALFDSFNPFLNRDAEVWKQLVAATLAAFAGPNLVEMLKANFRYDWCTLANDWTFPLALLGRLFIGAAIGRSAALARPKEHARTWFWLLLVTMPVGIGLTAFASFADERIVPQMLRPSLHGATSLSLALAYIAIFVLIFQLPAWQRRLSPLVAVGRMALTNYLLQTLIAILLFYGVGFGLGPRFGLIGTLPFFAAIFSLQIIFSQRWLSHFQFGPVEWIWRCLSYGFVIPMRKNRRR